MRTATVTLLGALGFAISAATASAAPVIANPHIQQTAGIVQVAGGCGLRFHPNRWGQCVPNRYSNRYIAPRRSHSYYGSSYAPRPYWRGRGYYVSPSDHVARQLNSQELGRLNYGSSMPYRGY